MKMKKGTYLLPLLLSFISIAGHSQEIGYLTIEDNYTLGKTHTNISQGAKSTRTRSAGRGTFIIEYDNINDKERAAINAAADIWSAYLNNGDTIRLSVKYGEGMTCDLKTSVAYVSVPSKIKLPSCLYRRTNDFEGSDAVISINKDSEWDVDSENGSSQKKNLTYACLRSIAQVLGFGTCLEIKENGRIVTSKKYGYSLFDGLIISSQGDKLTDIPDKEGKKNVALEAFVQPSCGYLYVKEVNDKYKLYAPSTFDNSKSLRYLMNPSSLMNYEEADEWGAEIDDITIELLNEIGWNLNKPTDNSLRIVGTGIDDSGIASAYSSHHFHLMPTPSSISNPHWELQLPLPSGGFQTVQTSNGTDLTTPAITNEGAYLHDSEGDIHAKVVFSGTVNGQDVELLYNLTLELKPRINKVECSDFTVSPVSNVCFDALLNISYEGASYVYVTVKEEDAASATVYSSSTPYYATVKLNTVDGLGKVTVRVKVQNQYGTVTKTLIIPKQFEADGSQHLPSSISNMGMDGFDANRISDNKEWQSVIESGINSIRILSNGQQIKKVIQHK